MATIVNDRDLLLQAETERASEPYGSKALVLSVDTPVFAVDAGGLGSPSLINLTVQLINISGTVHWFVAGASAVTPASDTRHATLAYADMAGDIATVEARVTYLGVTYIATQIIQKVKNGTQGISNALVYAYKRSATAPTDNPGDVTYSFTSKQITVPATETLANGWHKTIPAGTDTLYVILSSASGYSATDDIAAAEWAAPAVLGASGLPGLNSATVHIYQRSASATAPGLPTADTTYTFATGVLSGLNNGWSFTIPSGSGKYLYTSTATAVANTATDTISASEWATAALMASNGNDGATGPTGSPGGSGPAGQRGTVTLAANGYSSWWDGDANSVIASNGYWPPMNGDIVTLYSSSFSQTRFFAGTYGSGGYWAFLNAYLNGNMVVSGTFAADKISAGSNLSGVNIYGGSIGIASGHTTSGRAFEVTNTGVVWTDNIIGGIGWFNNNYLRSAAGVQVESYGNIEAVVGNVVNTNSNIGAHGVRGRNMYRGTSGLIGGYNNYDFYADGSGTNYGPFTGAHDALIPTGYTIEPGDIVCDVVCIARRGISNTIFEVELSSAPYQSSRRGVWVNTIGDLSDHRPAAFIDQFYAGVDPTGRTTSNTLMSETYYAVKDVYEVGSMNGVGEGQMNVCGEGGDIRANDLIVTSSMPGKGMRQSDDIVRSCTVAQAREGCTFSFPGEVKTIACIYVCG